MAENSEPVAAAREPSTAASQQGGATDPSEALYRAFDSYPWQKDQEFASQLIYNLYNTAPGTPGLSDVALHARVRRFEAQTKIHVDADAYKQWLTRTGGRQPRLVSEQMVAEEAAAMPESERRLAQLLLELGDDLGNLPAQQTAQAVPSWQAAAPKAELYVPKDASAQPSDPDKEPYPKKFEEIVEFIKTGKEIPGIRKIPDTVIDDPAITPQGRLTAPPKPWEVGRAPAGSDAPALQQVGDGST